MMVQSYKNFLITIRFVHYYFGISAIKPINNTPTHLVAVPNQQRCYFAESEIICSSGFAESTSTQQNKEKQVFLWFCACLSVPLHHFFRNMYYQL